MDKLAQAFIPPSRIDLAREADFSIGWLRVRPSHREVDASGARHELQPRVMQVLVALAQSSAEVVSHRELIMRCWSGLTVSDDAIGRCIAQLRRLAASWSDPPFEIETIAGVGYRLDVTTVGAGGAAPTSRPASFLRRPRTWIALAGAGLILAVTVWAVRYGLPSWLPQPPARVAVLPFDTLGAGPDGQAFTDRLQDEILGVLSSNQIPALSRSDSVSLHGAQADAALRRFGIGFFLDGTVRQQGDRLEVRVYLVDAKDRATLWSKDFDGPASQPAALQAKIAARAADAAQNALIGRRGAALDSAGLAAWIEALDELDNGADRSEPDKSEPLLRQVTVQAPNFARAHSALAIALSSTTNTPHDQLPGRMAAARAEAQRALELNPKIGEAYLALQRSTPMGQWRQREDLLLNGLAVDPDFSYLNYFRSQFLGQVGRNREALAAAARTVALDPLFVGASTNLCARLTYLDRPDEAREACERVDRYWPGSPINEITQAYLELGTGRDRESAERLRKPAVRAFLGNAASEALRRFVEARAAGDLSLSRAAALAAAKEADFGAVDRRDAYIALALAGDVDDALQQARRFYTAERMNEPAGDTSLDTTLLFVQATASVRRDPRFMALVAQIGLADYWRASGHWPDFCAEPGLPYDCRAEAAKVVPAKSSGAGTGDRKVLGRR